MKLLYVFLLLSYLSMSHAQNGFKAITYNIKYNDIMADKDTWDDRKDAMLVFFQDEDSDFIGLQEVLEDQLYFIDKGLQDYESIGVGRDDGKKSGEFSPILYNSSRWKKIEDRTIWLSETPDKVSMGWDAACNRIITFSLFSNVVSGDTIAVFNTHFDHKGEKARQNSVDLLVEFVENQSKGHPALILGDFNLEPRDDLYYTLIEHFKDAKRKSYSVHEDHEGTYNGFNLKGKFKKRIDYVFYKGEIDAISYICPDLRIDGRHVSDHFPIIVVMDFVAD